MIVDNIKFVNKKKKLPYWSSTYKVYQASILGLSVIDIEILSSTYIMVKKIRTVQILPQNHYTLESFGYRA